MSCLLDPKSQFESRLIESHEHDSLELNSKHFTDWISKSLGKHNIVSLQILWIGSVYDTILHKSHEVNKVPHLEFFDPGPYIIITFEYKALSKNTFEHGNHVRALHSLLDPPEKWLEPINLLLSDRAFVKIRCQALVIKSEDDAAQSVAHPHAGPAKLDDEAPAAHPEELPDEIEFKDGILSSDPWLLQDLFHWELKV